MVWGELGTASRAKSAQSAVSMAHTNAVSFLSPSFYCSWGSLIVLIPSF